MKLKGMSESLKTVNMKKYLSALVLGATSVILVSCGNKSAQQQTPEADPFIESMVVNDNKTLFGICSDEIGDNSIQLILDSGDTLTLDITEARENNKILGGLHSGCKLATITDDAKTKAELIINENSLLGNWVMLNPLDGSSYVGIRIKDGGIAESIEQSTIIYKTWRIVDGKLEITLVREGGGDMEEINVYDITKLDSDSLIYEDSEDFFDYIRQEKLSAE